MIPNAPVSLWQYFDFIVLGILTVVIGALLYSHKKNNGSLLATISQTIAHSKKSSLIFSLTMTVCYPIYYLFLWFWVGPKYLMPAWYYYLIFFAAVTEFIFVWVPSTTGRRKLLHDISASTVGIVMFITPVLIYLFGTGISKVSKFAILFFTLVSLVLLILILQINKRKYTVVYEALYIILFIISVSVIAHSWKIVLSTSVSPCQA